MDPDGSVVAFTSAVAEHKGKLYIGNLVEDYVSIYSLGDAA